MLSILINSTTVPIEYKDNSLETIILILKEPKVQEYFSNIQPVIVPSKINILSHYMFGKTVGFVFMNIESIHKYTGKKLAGVVFIRGGSVACLILIKNKDTGVLNYIKLIQTRVACGGEIEEICAGMLDRCNVTDKIMMKGAMINEIEEETGIKVSCNGVPNKNPFFQFNYLEELGEFYPSGGCCDEIIKTYWYMCEMSNHEIELLQGSLIDRDDTTEYIKIVIDKFTIDSIIKTKDSKAICATLQLLNKYPNIFY